MNQKQCFTLHSSLYSSTLIFACLGACSSTPSNSPNDAGLDSGTIAADAGHDARPDTAGDASPDASLDASPDATRDAAPRAPGTWDLAELTPFERNNIGSLVAASCYGSVPFGYLDSDLPNYYSRNVVPLPDVSCFNSETSCEAFDQCAQNSVTRAVTSGTCTPGCDGNNVRFCPSPNRETILTCANTCEVRDGFAVCVETSPSPCDSGQDGCTGERTSTRCDPFTQRSVASICDEGLQCVDGPNSDFCAPATAACTASRCEGNLAIACENNEQRTRTDCSLFGLTCEAGRCVGPNEACGSEQARTPRCVGNVLQICGVISVDIRPTTGSAIDSRWFDTDCTKFGMQCVTRGENSRCEY